MQIIIRLEKAMTQGPRNRFYGCLCRILMVHIALFFFLVRESISTSIISKDFDMKSQQQQTENVLIICSLAQFVMHIKYIRRYLIYRLHEQNKIKATISIFREQAQILDQCRIRPSDMETRRTHKK